MDASTVEMVKLGMSAGALGMNFLIIWLIFRLADKYIGPAIEAMNAAAQAFGSLKGKIDDVAAESKRATKEVKDKEKKAA